MPLALRPLSTFSRPLSKSTHVPVSTSGGTTPRPLVLTIAVFLPLILMITGCGGVKPVKGGTAGLLLIDGEPYSDMQITFYPNDDASLESIGFGVTNLEGEFELMKMGATGPLYLPTGEYRCTVETAGAPINLPKEYLQPEKSPLTIDWTEGESVLEVNVPFKRQNKPIGAN